MLDCSDQHSSSIRMRVMRNIIEELEQEASFWRELIESRQGEVEEYVLQHMRDALMLVEYKLAQMTDSYH